MYGWHHLVKTMEVTAGLVSSNGSLLLGGWFKVTCGLTVHWDQLRDWHSITSMVEIYLSTTTTILHLFVICVHVMELLRLVDAVMWRDVECSTCVVVWPCCCDMQVYEVVDRLCELRDSWTDTWGDFSASNIAVVTPYQDQVVHAS